MRSLKRKFFTFQRFYAKKGRADINLYVLMKLVYNAKNEAASTMYKAQRVQAVAKRLKEAGIVFAIVPDFPFEVTRFMNEY